MSRINQGYMGGTKRKGPLWPESLSYQKKDGRAVKYPCITCEFHLLTALSEITITVLQSVAAPILLLVCHRLFTFSFFWNQLFFSFKVGVIPKEGLRTLRTFLRDAAQYGINQGYTSRGGSLGATVQLSSQL